MSDFQPSWSSTLLPQIGDDLGVGAEALLLQNLTLTISQPQTLEAVLVQVVQQVCEYARWPCGQVWLSGGEGAGLRCVGFWSLKQPNLEAFGALSLSQPEAPGANWVQQVCQQRQGEWLPHLAKGAFSQAEVAVQAGLTAAIAMPIQAQEHGQAVLVFFMAEAGDDRAVRWVQAIATQLDTVMHLKQSGASLDAQQQWLNRLIDALPGIVFTAKGSPHWDMRYLSQGCLRLTGYTSEELTDDQGSFCYNTIIAPEDLPHVLHTIHQGVMAHQPYVAEYRIQTRSGGLKWVWEKGHGLYDEAGTVQGIEGFITDISDLKQTEGALRESEARYRLLAEQSRDMISQHTLAGTYCYASPACEDLLGYGAEDLVGRPIYDFLHPEDVGAMVDLFSRFQQYSDSQKMPFRMRHRSGGYRWFEMVSCLIDSSDAIERREILAVSRDITERMAAEQALRDRERFLRLVLDNIPQHLFWKDKNGLYLGCNQTFAHTANLASPEDIVGKSDYELCASREDAEYFRARDRLVMSREQPDLNVVEYQPYGDGSYRWVSCSKLPIHDSNGKVVGVLGTFEDISDRIAAQQALARREQYLTALVNVQRQLLTFDATWSRDRYTQILEPLGKAAGASRAYVYEVTAAGFPQPEPVLYQRAEWSAKGIPATVDNPNFTTLPIARLFDTWVARLSEGAVINQTLEQFTPLQQQALGHPPANVRSILLLPLLIKGHLYGVIGFSNCMEARPWTRSEVSLLQVAATALALAIERDQAEVSQRQTETKYRSIFENAVEGIFQSTPDGRYRIANPMLARIYGYDSSEELINSLTNIAAQLYVDANRRDTFVRRMLKRGAVLGFESQVYRKDGSIIWISESARTIYDAEGNLVGFEGTVENITARKEAEAELHRRDRLLQGVAQASQHLLTATDFKTAMPQVLNILGTAADADRVYLYENHPHPFTGKPAMSMRYEWTHTDIPATIHQTYWQNQVYAAHGLERWYRSFLAGQSIRGLVRHFPIAEQDLLKRDGIQAILMVPVFIDLELWGYIGFDECGQERQWTRSEESILVAIAASIGGALKRQRTERQMCYQAFHDPLTGLPNRMLFNQRLTGAIAQAQRQGEALAVLFLDLDRFKTINDTLGHAVGDQLLCQATQRLNQGLRETDILARWGGDEFTLVLPHLPCPSDAAHLAQRLAELLKPPFLIDNQELYITSSIGIALYPQDGRDMTTLLQHADAAMYRAKAEGRNTYRFYTATIHASTSQQLTLEKYLHHALERDELRIFFQPQINLPQRRIVQIEALLRWESPKLGWIAPNQFIPIAEEIGLIIDIGDWVLKQACTQLKAWHDQGFTPLRMAVNLSARQLQQPDLVERLAHLLMQLDLPAETLELEITETAALLDIEASIATLNELRQLGTRIVMDDFGTGYSSLSYLKQFPVQGLKIDRAFVREIPNNAQDVAMLRAITALGQELSLDVIAEGVETAAQLACLQSLGCRDMQGFWFSHPLDAPEMTQFLHQHWPTYDFKQTHS